MAVSGYKADAKTIFKHKELVANFVTEVRAIREAEYGIPERTFEAFYTELLPSLERYGCDPISNDHDLLAAQNYGTFINGKINQIKPNLNASQSPKGIKYISAFLEWMSRYHPQRAVVFCEVVKDFYVEQGMQGELRGFEFRPYTVDPVPASFPNPIRAVGGIWRKSVRPFLNLSYIGITLAASVFGIWGFYLNPGADLDEVTRFFQGTTSSPQAAEESQRTNVGPTSLPSQASEDAKTKNSAVVSQTTKASETQETAIQESEAEPTEEAKPTEKEDEVSQSSNRVASQSVPSAINPWEHISDRNWSIRSLTYFLGLARHTNFDALEKAVEQGDQDARTLAAMFCYGGRLPQERQYDCLKLAQVACDGGQGRACAVAAVHYRQGIGVARNYSLGASLYRRGCELGNLRSCHYYHGRQWEGEGVTRDYDAAIEGWERACAMGEPESCKSLPYARWIAAR